MRNIGFSCDSMIEQFVSFSEGLIKGVARVKEDGVYTPVI